MSTTAIRIHERDLRAARCEQYTEELMDDLFLSQYNVWRITLDGDAGWTDKHFVCKGDAPDAVASWFVQDMKSTPPIIPEVGTFGANAHTARLTPIGCIALTHGTDRADAVVLMDTASHRFALIKPLYYAHVCRVFPDATWLWDERADNTYGFASAWRVAERVAAVAPIVPVSPDIHDDMLAAVREKWGDDCTAFYGPLPPDESGDE